MAIGVLDFGMTAEQVAQLRPLVSTITHGQWNFDFPARANSPQWVQAMAGRPFLRDYFPGYRRYLWIDADIWFQDSRAVDLLTARLGEDVCLAPEIHSAYRYLYGLDELRSYSENYCAESFGSESAQLLSNKPILNSGMFAADNQSSFWDEYRTKVIDGFMQTPNRWTEQCALNLALYQGSLHMRPLPAWCNWLCSYALPAYDPVQRCLCEPTAPFEKLSGIHITKANQTGLKLTTTARQEMEMSIDYDGFQRTAGPGLGWEKMTDLNIV